MEEKRSIPKKVKNKMEEKFDSLVFSQNFASLRAAKGITKKKMADMLDISPTTVTAYEEGTKSPTLFTASRIARVFNVSLDWLCGITVKEETQGTYSEILSYMFKLSRLTDTAVDVESDAFSCDGHSGVLKFYDRVLVEFMKEWRHIKPLVDSHTIDDSLYDPWIAQKLRDYDCSTEEIPNCLDIAPF